MNSTATSYKQSGEPLNPHVSNPERISKQFASRFERSTLSAPEYVCETQHLSHQNYKPDICPIKLVSKYAHRQTIQTGFLITYTTGPTPVIHMQAKDTSSLPCMIIKERVTQLRDDITANIAIHTRRAILLLSILTLPQYLLCASSLAGPICVHAPSYQILLILFHVSFSFYWLYLFTSSVLVKSLNSISHCLSVS